MPVILLETRIHSTLEICFDLSRSIDLHQISTSDTDEKAVDGLTTGLIGMGEFVTWEARHFGIKQRLSSKITAYDRPRHFRDEQLKGIFDYFKHDHYFHLENDVMVMKDVFEYRSPLGFLGRIADRVAVTKHMTQLLETRNGIIKDFAESSRWKEVLKN